MLEHGSGGNRSTIDRPNLDAKRIRSSRLARLAVASVASLALLGGSLASTGSAAAAVGPKCTLNNNSYLYTIDKYLLYKDAVAGHKLTEVERAAFSRTLTELRNAEKDPTLTAAQKKTLTARKKVVTGLIEYDSEMSVETMVALDAENRGLWMQLDPKKLTKDNKAELKIWIDATTLILKVKRSEADTKRMKAEVKTLKKALDAC